MTIDGSDATGSEGFKSAEAACPAGTKLHGSGGSIIGAVGEARIDRVGLIGLGAAEGADIEAREDETGLTTNWQATTYAICAA